MDIYEMLEQVLERLRSRGRVTYRVLQAHFHLDDDLLALLKEELLFSHPVADEDGRGLVWMGEVSPVTRPLGVVPNQPVTAEGTAVTSPAVPSLPRRTTKADTPFHEATAPRQAPSTDTSYGGKSRSALRH